MLAGWTKLDTAYGDYYFRIWGHFETIVSRRNPNTDRLEIQVLFNKNGYRGCGVMLDHWRCTLGKSLEDAQREADEYMAKVNWPTTAQL